MIMVAMKLQGKSGAWSSVREPLGGQFMNHGWVHGQRAAMQGDAEAGPQIWGGQCNVSP